MLLSQQVTIGLKRLGNQNLINEECYMKLIQAAPDALLKTNTADQLNLSEVCTAKTDIVKESFAALLILLVESARHDLDGKLLSTILENYNINPKRLSSIINVYESNKLKLRNILFQIRKTLPIVIDVNWRLDLCVRSSGVYNPSCPTFFIQLICEVCSSQASGGIVIKKISFVCSLQELQELVGKLKDATRHVEAIAKIK